MRSVGLRHRATRECIQITSATVGNVRRVERTTSARTTSTVCSNVPRSARTPAGPVENGSVRRLPLTAVWSWCQPNCQTLVRRPTAKCQEVALPYCARVASLAHASLPPTRALGPTSQQGRAGPRMERRVRSLNGIRLLIVSLTTLFVTQPPPRRACSALLQLEWPGPGARALSGRRRWHQTPCTGLCRTVRVCVRQAFGMSAAALGRDCGGAEGKGAHALVSPYDHWERTCAGLATFARRISGACVSL